jgi:hypothetical protein
VPPSRKPHKQLRDLSTLRIFADADALASASHVVDHAAGGLGPIRDLSDVLHGNLLELRH